MTRVRRPDGTRYSFQWGELLLWIGCLAILGIIAVRMIWTG